jgi:transposase
MDVVVERCAGLDVHRDNVVATVRVPGTGRRRFEQQTQTFSSTLAGLAALSSWLAKFEVTLVGMEATGVYWKTVFQALEERFECWLLNAHHLRNVPGRKTDVKGLRLDLSARSARARAPELRAAAGDPPAA